MSKGVVRKASVTDGLTDGQTDRRTECKPIVPPGFTGGGRLIMCIVKRTLKTSQKRQQTKV